jgi:hypothetical protein
MTFGTCQPRPGAGSVCAMRAPATRQQLLRARRYLVLLGLAGTGDALKLDDTEDPVVGFRTAAPTRGRIDLFTLAQQSDLRRAAPDTDRMELDGNEDIAVGSRAPPPSNSKSDRPQNRLARPSDPGAQRRTRIAS